MGNHLIYLISHGHTARGAFQTGLLQKLVGAGNRVTVVTKDDPTGDLSERAMAQGASVEFYSAPRNRFSQQLGIFRSYVHQDIRLNPALWEKHQRRATQENGSLKRRAINKSYLPLGDFIRKRHRLRERYIRWERRQYKDEKATGLIRKLNPDAIFSTRPVDPTEIFLLNASRRLKIPRIMYILSWDNITAKGVFPELAEYYLTWGPIMNEELANYYGVQQEQMYFTGVTHFDVHHEISLSPKTDFYLRQLGLNSENPYIFFTMSASYYAPNEIEIVEYLADRVNKDRFGPLMQLVIRPHMANLMKDRSDQSWVPRLKKLNSERVRVDFPDADNTLLTWYMANDDMVRLSSLLNGAAVCLNSGSTVAIEALYLNRPVVITAFDTNEMPFWLSARRLLQYEHLKKLFATGACKIVVNLESMTTAIEGYLANPSIDKEHRQKAVELECFRNDGQATMRFVANTQAILEQL